MNRRPILISDTLIIILIVLIGLILRIYGATNYPVNFEEAHNIIISQEKNIALLIKTAKGYPPLYFLFLHYMQNISHNLFFLRCVSVFFGTVTILLIYFTGKKLFSRRLALLAAFLMSISPGHIYYSSVSRMYAFSILISTLIVWFFIKYIRNRSHARWLIITLLIALYTHFFFIILWLVLNIYILVWFRKKSLTGKWILANVTVAIFYIPGLRLLFTQEWLVVAASNSLLKLPAFLVISVIPWDLFQTLALFESQKMDIPGMSIMGLGALILALLIIFFVSLFKDKRFQPLTFVYYFSPLLIFIISYYFFRIAALRSFIIFSPVFYILLTAIILKLNTRLRQVCIFLVSFLSIIFIISYHYDYMGTRSMYSKIYTHFQNSDTVVYNDPLLYLPNIIYQPPGKHYLLSTGYFPEIAGNSSVKITSLDALPVSSRLWYVKQISNWPPFDERANQFEQQLRQNYQEVARDNYFRFSLIEYRYDK